MTAMEKIRMVWRVGSAVVDAILEGRASETVFDVLPNEYKAEARLRELDAKAREDFETGD